MLPIMLLRWVSGDDSPTGQLIAPVLTWRTFRAVKTPFTCLRGAPPRKADLEPPGYSTDGDFAPAMCSRRVFRSRYSLLNLEPNVRTKRAPTAWAPHPSGVLADGSDRQREVLQNRSLVDRVAVGNE